MVSSLEGKVSEGKASVSYTLFPRVNFAASRGIIRVLSCPLRPSCKQVYMQRIIDIIQTVEWMWWESKKRKRRRRHDHTCKRVRRRRARILDLVIQETTTTLLDVHPMNVLVVGGNGFIGTTSKLLSATRAEPPSTCTSSIGSAICKAALTRGMQVTSISSSGTPFRTPNGHLPAWTAKVCHRLRLSSYRAK